MTATPGRIGQQFFPLQTLQLRLGMEVGVEVALQTLKSAAYCWPATCCWPIVVVYFLRNDKVDVQTTVRTNTHLLSFDFASSFSSDLSCGSTVCIGNSSYGWDLRLRQSAQVKVRALVSRYGKVAHI